MFFVVTVHCSKFRRIFACNYLLHNIDMFVLFLNSMDCLLVSLLKQIGTFYSVCIYIVDIGTGTYEVYILITVYYFMVFIS